MHKLTVTLKQHTPLIHFQHDQEGATLRASEVKPKLDKFIISRLTNEQKEEGRRDGWLKEKEGKCWLDYKMRIAPGTENGVDDMETYEMNVPDQRWNNETRRNEVRMKFSERYNRQIPVLKPYPLFFANMDIDYETDNEMIKKLRVEDYLEMQLSSRVMPISEICSSRLVSDFFMTHNFGTRQSKGFGSFYIDEDDPLYIAPQSMYQFRVDDNADGWETAYKLLFTNIDLFYKTLRGGINVKNRNGGTDFYFKSLAFMYAKDVLESHWDKRVVKEQFYNDGRRYVEDRNHNRHEIDSLEKQQGDHENDADNEPLTITFNESYDIRDMLGFSTNEQWMSFKDSIEKKVTINRDGQLQYPRDNDDLPADRMQSPILFKPIYNGDGYTVHIVFKDSEVNMRGFKDCRKICIYSKKERDVNGRRKRFMINIPQNFTTENYFNFIFRELNFDISTHVEEQYQDRDEYAILEDIYSQIKENLQRQHTPQ